MEQDILDIVNDTDVEFDKTYKQRKMKRKFKRLLLVLICLNVVFAGVLIFASEVFRLTTINVEGNNIFSDEEIIDISNLKLNQSIVFALLTESEINLENNLAIKSANVTFDSLTSITITIREEPVLFKTAEGYYLKNGTYIEGECKYPVPTFENFEEVSKKDEVINNLSKLMGESPEVYEYISQIYFTPDVVTSDRIGFVMRDSNKVYVTTEQIYSKMPRYFEAMDLIYSKYGVIYGELSFDKGGEFKPYNS